MCYEAENWAREVPDLTSSQAFVLYALAVYASVEAWDAYPTLMTIEKITRLNRKTIIAALKVLRGRGLIVEVGKISGRKGLIPIYRLNPTVKPAGRKDSTKIGTVPKTVLSRNSGVPKTANNSAVFISSQSQKRDTELLNNNIELKQVNGSNPSEEPNWAEKLLRAGLREEDFCRWFNNNSCSFSLGEDGTTLIQAKNPFTKDRIVHGFDQALRRAFPNGYQVSAV